VTTRIVGVDINPTYLEVVRNRYQAKLPLVLHCLDLAAEAVQEAPVDLVHAALIFEHAGTHQFLDNAIALVAPSGYLATVVQLPSCNSEAAVAPSPYPTIQRLSEHFHLLEPADLRQIIEQRGFELQHETMRTLPAGKGFWLGIFRRSV